MNEEEKQAVVDTSDHPHEFICPITLELMIEPVMLFDDGHTYEKTAINEWIKSNNSSPITNERLYIKKFKTNFALKSQITRYKQHLFKQSSSKIATGGSTTCLNFISGISASHDFNHQNTNSNTSNKHKQYFISYSHIKIENLKAVKPEYYEIPDSDSSISSTSLEFEDEILNNAFDEISSKSLVKRPSAYIQTEDENIIEIYLQLVGDCNVGKTAFRKYIEFNDFRCNSSPTIGEEFSFVRFPNRYKKQYTIKVRIIDVGGQFDRFHSMSRMQYRSIHGAILVCSVDNKQSVNHLRNHWLKDLKEYAPDYIQCMVVCNKSDLLLSKNFNGISKNTVQKYKNILLFASQFAAENSFPIYNISCKSGSYVQQACKDLVDRILYDEILWKELLEQSIIKRVSMTLTPQYPQRNGNKNSCCAAS